MDAHSTVTAEEGDRYPLVPPTICPCSLMVEQRIYIPYATDNWLVWVRIPAGVPILVYVSLV